MIKPIADPITAPATELLFGKGHPELAQIAQLIGVGRELVTGPIVWRVPLQREAARAN